MEEIRVLGRLALATTYVETKAGVRPVWPASQNVHMHMHMHMHMCMHMCMCPHRPPSFGSQLSFVTPFV